MGKLYVGLAIIILLSHCTTLERHKRDIEDLQASIQNDSTIHKISTIHLEENDPRNYIKIYEIRDSYDKLDKRLIWNWDSTSSIANQRKRLIDINSEIEIQFNRKEISENLEFRGDISLQAELSGSKGFRKIEVLPYTEVGKDEERVGLPFRSSKEIAGVYLRIIDKVMDLNTFDNVKVNEFYSYMNSYYRTDGKIDTTYKLLLDQVVELSGNLQNNYYEKYKSSPLTIKRDTTIFERDSVTFKRDSTVFREILENFNFQNSSSNSYGLSLFELLPYQVSNFLKNRSYSFEDLHNSLNDYSNEVDQFFDDVEGNLSKRNKEYFFSLIKYHSALLAELKTDLTILNDQVKVFDGFNNQAKSAFLATTSSDLRQFGKLKTTVSNAIFNTNQQIEKIRNINQSDSTEIPSSLFNDFDSFLGDNSLMIYQISEDFKLEGTILGSIISKLSNGEMDFQTGDDTTSYENNANPDLVYFNEEIIADSFLQFNNTYTNSKNSLIVELALYANKIIFGYNLKFASIDLHKSGAKESELLYLYVKIYEVEESNGETVENVKILPLGRYELQQTGWITSIDDSFNLIQRLDQPDSKQDSTISPSNFKGAPGVSFMVTWNNDGSNKDGFWNFAESTLNYLEPSFGVNVSYVDFSTEKDLEIGAGFILGLFNKTIFFNAGWNLNGLSTDEVSPFYLGLGFSFLSLADKFNN